MQGNEDKLEKIRSLIYIPDEVSTVEDVGSSRNIKYQDEVDESKNRRSKSFSMPKEERKEVKKHKEYETFSDVQDDSWYLYRFIIII